MVWIVEKKVVHHMFGLGIERVKIPVRVTFEFEVKEGAFAPNSLSTQTVYNRTALEKRYPNLNLASLENSIDNTVRKEIMAYLKFCVFLENDSDSDSSL
jgi:hypothetical protein